MVSHRLPRPERHSTHPPPHTKLLATFPRTGSSVQITTQAQKAEPAGRDRVPAINASGDPRRRTPHQRNTTEVRQMQRGYAQ